ncbi:MAG: hypothetical protein MUF16_07345 [Burkholderiaceae bacterium]|nr:hypothetical protein [Burkholderiaceae bacterium]
MSASPPITAPADVHRHPTRRRAVALVATCATLPLSGAQATGGLRKEEVRFDAGTSATSITGQIRGDEGVDYLVRARAGQTLTVSFKPSNPMAYFNVLPPGSDEALFVGSSAADGSLFMTQLPRDGVYTLRVYLMRAAARRNETARYTLGVSVTGAAQGTAGSPTQPAAPAGPFEQRLELLGIGFQVSSPNKTAGNSVRIVPSGLQIDNAPIEMEVAGQVVGAEVADLNVDRSPELYVYVRGPAPEQRGTLLAVSANNRKSLGFVNLPELAEHRGASAGYQGHDDMAVVESRFVRRFPLYGKDGDASKPTGRTRQLQYKLAKGEASWVLKLDRMIEY